jgi:biotin carboxylase
MTPTVRTKRLVAVVDAYSGGRFLPRAYRNAGADVVHVQSTPAVLATVPPPDLAPYVATIVHRDLDDTIARLRARGVVAVVPGQESGVPLADLLSERLGLPGNGTARTSARRNKYDMIETLRAAGVACARQARSDDVAAVVAWAEAEGYPVVVKPLSSASTDGVSICRSPDEVAAAAGAVLGSRDIFEQLNREVLVQTYLDGTEYVVDAVCCAGARHVCGVWRYDKVDVGTKRLYDRETVVAPDGPPVAELVAYLDTVLAALDIRVGAAHAEIMLTAAGPALVEIGARCNGNMDPDFHDMCLGANQADLMALSTARPEEFAARYPGDTLYRKRRHGVIYNARTTQDGIVTAVDDAVLAEMRHLDRVRLVLPRVAVGGRIRPTVDLLSSPLRVYLASDDQDSLVAAYEKVLALAEGVYRVAPQEAAP